MPLIYRGREINDSKNSLENRVEGVVQSAMKSPGRNTVHEPQDIPSKAHDIEIATQLGDQEITMTQL